MAGSLLLAFSSFFLFFRVKGMEHRETHCSFVTSITGWILRSLLTAWANSMDMAQAVFSLSDD